MPANTNIALTPDVWVLLTNADVTALRIQNRSGISIILQATVGAGAPSGDGGAVELLPYGALAADMTLAQLWPGVPGANRVWARSWSGAMVSVSHA